MSDSTAAPTQGVDLTMNGLSLLVSWANQQDGWVRALVSEAIETRKPLGEARVIAFYEMLLAEKELSGEQAPVVQQITPKAVGATADEILTLEKLSEVRGVNALATGQTIQFNPRMNILFGENGSGKTGYVRILKTVAAVRTAEQIIPDITKPTPTEKPSATIIYRLGASQHSLPWNGERGLPPLTRMDIFDNRGVLIHLDDDLTYTYTPNDLELFRIVHDGIEQVKQRLEKARDEKVTKGNPFITKFGRDTSVFTKIEALGPTTELSELQTLATLTTEDDAELPALRERVEALKLTSSDARLQVARAEADLLQALLSAIQVMEGFDSTKYGEQRASLEEAIAKHREATQQAFAGDNIPGALTDAWRAFIEAGDKYIHETSDKSFPQTGDACIYCRQSLGETAVALIQKYRAYCDDTFKAAADRARANLASITEGVAKLDLTRLSADLQKKKANFNGNTPVPQVFEAALQLIERARGLQAAIKDYKEPASADSLFGLDETKRLTVARITEANAIVADLTQQATSRQAELERQSERLKILDARITLRDLLPSIKTYVEVEKWINRAETIIGRIGRSIGKSLTETAKTASEKLVNDDFGRLFDAECLALKAPKVKLDFPGKKGQPARKKHLAVNYKLSDLLSEGEQKVVALADFIAEASLRRAAPVVFDDPVNSLDYKRIHHVVNRLVQISQQRQVLVFTHNIWFTMELLSRFEKRKEDCAYYDVSESEPQKGFVSGGEHPRADTFKTLSGKINQLIQDAGSSAATHSAATKDALIEKAYGHLRAACEVIVEADLLQGVTQRYQPNVMMTKLPAIRPDRLGAAITIIAPIFERVCRYIDSHSQPLETMNVRPSLQDLEADWKAIKDARTAYLA
jgi:ABC-type transport system involved in cytochrome c biogenesis ATPase subunit